MPPPARPAVGLDSWNATRVTSPPEIHSRREARKLRVTVLTHETVDEHEDRSGHRRLKATGHLRHSPTAMGIGAPDGAR